LAQVTKTKEALIIEKGNWREHIDSLESLVKASPLIPHLQFFLFFSFICDRDADAG
jgi:hypothetical protein